MSHTDDWLSVGADANRDAPGAVALPGAALRTRSALFAALTDALDLPGYRGDTWDALADVLADRLDAGPLTLLITDAEQVLADEPADQHALLLAVLRNLAGSAGHPLRVLLRDTPD
ncbi:barstar family protein [Micromonospora sp. NPDC047557]|uniref:barstar family protein n=1 Tax=Micromonospora sp. NPDC047557 TaxID=3364250 RepID=UPI00371088F9